MKVGSYSEIQGCSRHIDESKVISSLIFAKTYLKLGRSPNLIKIGVNATYGNVRGYYSSNDLTIYVASYLKEQAFYETFFHELVHFKQHQAGWLKETKDSDGKSIYFWKKSNTRGKGYQITCRKTYRKAPHEVQARDLAKRMLSLYLQRPY